MNRLLTIFAHPDDESLACGGLLARCADAGVHVSLLCVTQGEDASTPDGDREALRTIRTQELEDATRLLGVSDVILLDYPDGELPWLDEARRARLDEDLRAVISRVRPDVVITFGEDGLYWHPDHIVLYERTTAVIAGLGATAPALYYVTMPKGAMRALVDTVAHATPDGHSHRHIFGIYDPDAFGVLAQQPTLVVDVSGVAVRKLAAMQSHRSQAAGGAIERLAAADAARVLGVEHFRRAPVGAQGPNVLERFAS